MPSIACWQTASILIPLKPQQPMITQPATQAVEVIGLMSALWPSSAQQQLLQLQALDTLSTRTQRLLALLRQHTAAWQAQS